ncbi:MAG: hypothetical protein AAGE94_12660 [Acidobacteriota bacterium]
MELFEIAPESQSGEQRFPALVDSPVDATASSCVFGEYLRTLLPGADEATDEQFAAFFGALRRLIRRQLIRRGLWIGPPRFVGVAGGDRWTAEALDEIASDALIHLLERIRSLQRHVQTKPRIDGLVRLEIGHFLHDRQRRADPLGHRLYSVVHEALRQTIESGEIEVIDGDPRLSNSTALAPTGGPPPIESCRYDEQVPLLDRVVRRWVDDLMPELVTGWGKRRARVVRELADHCREWSAAGLGEVRFKAFLDAVKRAVRWRWAEVLAHEASAEATDEVWRALAPSIGSATPDMPFEARQGLDALVACVTRQVEDASDLGARSQTHFRNLWHFLRLRVLDPSHDAAGLPSRRRIAELLGIPRSTLGGLYERLGRLVEVCRGGCEPPIFDAEDRSHAD